MKEIIINASRGRQLLPALIAAFIGLFILVGCAGGNHGTFKRDRDLDNMFLNYEVLPDYRYYTTGGYDAPNAILAVHRDYELDNSGGLWVGVPNIDTAQMQKWIDTIAPEQNYRYSDAYFATWILDPEGKKAGVWYSYANTTTVKFLEENKIQVYTPDLNQNLNKGLRRRGIP